MSRALRGSAAGLSLSAVISALRRHYGAPLVPQFSGVFERILRENIAYLASPEEKRGAFVELQSVVGTRPDQILAAPAGVLEGIAAHGILKKITVGKIRRCAQVASERFAGDVDAILKEPVEEAARQLRLFPGIGAPGAEKILLFSGRVRGLAPDSNGLRVLCRLGLVREEKAYGRTYGNARSLTDGSRWPARRMQEAHLLLQSHGRTLCRRSRPLCRECPLRGGCPFGAREMARS